MKTPMKELLERVKEYRDSETSPLVISRLNSICVDIFGMLQKEIDVFEEIIDIIDSENSGLSAEQRLDEISRLIKTFNTKER